MPAKPLILAASAILAAAPAIAQQSRGTITGTLDLDEAAWTVAPAASGASTGWNETEAGREVRIVARPRGSTSEESVGNILTISMTAVGNAVEAEAADIRVTYIDSKGQELTAEGPNVELSLTALAEEGDELAVAGDLVATLTPGQGDGIVLRADAGDGAVFDGNFQATILRSHDE